MKQAEAMRRVTRIVKAASWEIRCAQPPYPHAEVIHWTDRVGPKRHAPMLGIEDLEEAPERPPPQIGKAKNTLS